MARLLFLLAILILPLRAQHTLFRNQGDSKTDTYVEVTGLFSQIPPSGYYPVRVKISNQTLIPRSFTLECTSSIGYGERGSKVKSVFSFDAPAENASEHDILVPITSICAEDSISLQVQLSGGFGNNNGSVSGSYANNQPAVLLGETLFVPNASSLDAAAATRFSVGYRSRADSFAAKFSHRQMPEDWRAYSGFDSLILTDTEWTGASAPARNAVIAWVRLGGQLIVQSSNGSRSGLNLPDDPGFGEIQVATLDSSLILNTNELLNHVDRKPINSQHESIGTEYSTHWPLQSEFGTQGFSYGLFALILIVFGIIVGPVNLFVFAKSGRRHRLFITTPIISLVTSAILIVLILFMDGFGGRGIRTVLMEVRADHGENSAYLHQEQFCRTGVLTGSRFSLQESAVITPVPINSDNRWARLTPQNSGGGLGYTTNFVDGKLETSGDWFQSRSEQGQLLSAVVPTRGRVELASSEGSPQLISTFDFRIDELYYRDKSGQWWKAGPVEPGNRFRPFTISEAEAVAAQTSLQNTLVNRHQQLIHRVLNRKEAFFAVTKAAPGIETYRSIDWTQTQTVITGPVVTP